MIETLDLSYLAWLIAAACALMVGFSKTGLPGAGILVVPLLAQIMPARQSVGFLLPLLCAADVMAMLYWRRHVEWPKLLRLLPWSLLGVAAGYLLLSRLTNQTLMPTIGVVILILLGVTAWRNLSPNADQRIPTHIWFAALMGLLAGSTTMLANAAGPVMTIYLLAMRLKKKEFLGTGAWYFWIVNLIKVPLSHNLGLITAASLWTNLALTPAIIAGGFLGIFLAHRIGNRVFNITVTILAAVAATTLIVRSII